MFLFWCIFINDVYNCFLVRSFFFNEKIICCWGKKISENSCRIIIKRRIFDLRKEKCVLNFN